MNKYKIMMEGYTATGNCCSDRYLGEYSGSSFRNACRKALKEKGYDMRYWNSKDCSFWGCRLYEIVRKEEL